MVYHCCGKPTTKDQFIASVANSVPTNNMPLIDYMHISSLKLLAKRPRDTSMNHTDIGYQMHSVEEKISECTNKIKAMDLL